MFTSIQIGAQKANGKYSSKAVMFETRDVEVVRAGCMSSLHGYKPLVEGFKGVH